MCSKVVFPTYFVHFFTGLGMCVEHLIIILRILHLKDDKTEIHGN